MSSTNTNSVAQLLENAILSPDQTSRAAAEAQLDAFSKEQFVPYLGMLTQTLGDESLRVEVRMLAGIAIKNHLTAKDTHTRAKNIQRWLSLDQEAKAQIKNTALTALVSSNERVANAAAQLVAAIADIELPRNEWPDLMNVLVANTAPENSVAVKRSSLLAIGYICETADPSNDGVVAQANGILTAIVQGAQSSEQSPVVRLTAINALVNSLDFIRENFKRENERNYIMQVVCEGTQAPQADVQAAAFGALSKIMSSYYQYMRLYMEQALYGLTVQGMKSENENVACMAVEFWSTVCEEEIMVKMHQLDSLEPSGIPNQSTGLSSASTTSTATSSTAENPDNTPSSNIPKECFNFAKYAIRDVLPTLLELLTKQEEDADDDEWNLSMAAGSCLQLFAQDTGSDVVQIVLQFAEANINSSDWQKRDAAVMAFGSIMDGPDATTLAHLIRQALPSILVLIKDPSLQVKDTVAWCLGRIADYVIEGIDVTNQLSEIIQALLLGFTDAPRVSTNCCWTLINLTEQLNMDGPTSETAHMSKYYEALIPALETISGRPNNDASSRTSAYEALSTLVAFAANDVLPLVHKLSSTIVERLEATIEMQNQIVGMDDKANLEEVQSSLLAVLTSIIRRIGSGVSQASDRLMTILLRMLQNKLPNSLIEEDIFIAIGAVANSIDDAFSVYVDAFVPFLHKALEEADFQICNTAVGLVADICHALGPAATKYCNDFMSLLLANLSKENVRRDLKPAILSCFGDIASSIGGAFEPYLPVVMQILTQASQLRVSPESSSDFVEYIITLRESIIDAYVGIVSAFQNNPQILLGSVQPIFGFLAIITIDRTATKSESIARSVVGLIGDIASLYPNGEVKAFYKEEWVTDLIKWIRSEPNFGLSTQETARWAREQQKRQLEL